ncbi:MAG: class I SAM-dependent methyltransferase [Gemmatimonadaceae bacterium]
MKLDQLREEWTALGTVDPLWAVLSEPAMRGGRWDTDAFFATGRKDVDGVLALISNANVELEHRRALDFGCGVGRLSQALARKFDEVVGVDISSTMLEGARRFDQSDGRCKFVLNTTDDLSQFPTASFDFVYSHIVLQHMEPIYSLGYIREFTRLLRKGGVAVFQIPVANNTRRIRDVIKSWFPGLVKKLHNIRHPGIPIIELYAAPMEGIDQALAAGGMTVFATTDDPNGNRGSHGVVFFARKGSVAGDGSAI